MTWTPPPILRALDLVAETTQTVAGLTDQKLRLANVLVRHAYAARNERTHAPANVVILGQTGGGKTFLTQQMLKASGLPFIEVNCTMFSEAGYHGADLPWMFTGFLDKYSHSSKETKELIPQVERWGVVVLDEFDKWRLRKTGAMELQQQRALQAEMLKIIEGDMISAKRKDGDSGWIFNTSNILYIACGSFEGLGDQIGDQPKKDHMLVEPSDLIQFGFLGELIGRFPNLLPLPNLDVAAMLRIWYEHIWLRYLTEFTDGGVDLVIDDAAVTEIAQQAIVKKTGARALTLIMEKSLWKAWGKAAPGDRVRITVNSVMGGGEAVLEQASPV